MNKTLRLLEVLSLIIISLLVASCVAYFIGENFFFDTFFFGKSTKYGYAKNVVNLIDDAGHHSPIIEKRISDIRYLIDQSKNKSQVLGQSTIDKEMFSVALIGDSFVYGMGVQLKDRIGEQLGKKLNKIRPTKVYNLAQSGDSVLDNYAKLELAHKYLKPDVSIIVLVENDMYFDFVNKYPGGQEIFDRISPLCLGKLHKFEYGKYKTRDELMNFVDYPSISSEFVNACLFKTVLSEINSKYDNNFYMVLAPIGDSKELKKSADNEYLVKLAEIMQTYVDIIRETGGLVLMPASTFAYKRVSLKEGHANSETNDYYATMIFNELTTNVKWRFVTE